MCSLKRIKHNFITIMPLKAAILVAIGAFVFLAGQNRLPLAVGQTKGEAILTGVRVDNRPLSPSQRHLATAEQDMSRVPRFLVSSSKETRDEGNLLRAVAYGEKKNGKSKATLRLAAIMACAGCCPDADIEFVYSAYQAGLFGDELDRYIGFMTRQAVLGSKLAAQYRDEFSRHKKDFKGLETTLIKLKLTIPIPEGQIMSQLMEPISTINDLHEAMAQPIYHPLIVAVDMLPLELQDLLGNTYIDLHGGKISAYDFLRSCVDEVIFSPCLRVVYPSGSVDYTSSCMIGSYIATEIRPGKRIICIGTLYPLDLLADVDKRPMPEILPENEQNLFELFLGIINAAAARYIQKLIHEGALGPEELRYETDADWRGKITTTVERSALMNLRHFVQTRFSAAPDAQNSIAQIEAAIQGPIQETIREHNRNLGIAEDDFSLPGVFTKPIDRNRYRRLIEETQSAI